MKSISFLLEFLQIILMYDKLIKYSFVKPKYAFTCKINFLHVFFVEKYSTFC